MAFLFIEYYLEFVSLKRLQLAFILLTLLSCKEKTVKVVSINSISSNYDTLITMVRVKGDTNAYDELFYSFIDANDAERIDSVLIYSKIMASNFNYERAYWDHLRALCNKNEMRFDNFSNLDLTKLDATSKEAIIKWLNEMLEKGILNQEEYNSVRK